VDVHQSKRYLGLDLAGAKNQKSALAVLEFYPKEKKIFLLDIFDRIIPGEGQSADQALLELIAEFSPGVEKMAVNAPLDLPPCLPCKKVVCPGADHCQVAAVKWMRRMSRKHDRAFTPYTQRPVELWIRYQLLPEFPVSHRFDIDEAMGGSKAALTARMHFLKRHLKEVPLLEAWPKLTMALLFPGLDLPTRVMTHYRKPEDGAPAREAILNRMIEKHLIFVYDRDVRKLVRSLATFDAFLCAYTALLAGQETSGGKGSKSPRGFPANSGWVVFP